MKKYVSAWLVLSFFMMISGTLPGQSVMDNPQNEQEVGLQAITLIEKSPQKTIVPIEIPVISVCDSPNVLVPIRCPQGITNMGKFRITVRYLNPSFMFNGNMEVNPAVNGLSWQYYPGGATDILIVERNDSTPVSLGDDYIFRFHAAYYGGEWDIHFDTSFQSQNQSFIRDAFGIPMNTVFTDGKVVHPVACCVIASAPAQDTLVLLPVSVVNMHQVYSFSLKIIYQYNFFEFLGLTNIHPALSPISNLLVTAAGGFIDCKWYYPGNLINPGTADLFYLKFKVLPGTLTGSYPVFFATDPPSQFTTLDTTGLQTIPSCFYGGYIDILNMIEPEPLRDNSIGVYPNPSPDGVFKLHCLDGCPFQQLVIMDITGRKVFELIQYSASGQPDKVIDLGHFPTGIYLLRGIAAGHVFHQKLIIHRQ